MLPMPDFSMPYNVITITCTILALFFGQLVNGITVSYADIWEGLRTFQPVRYGRCSTSKSVLTDVW